MNGLLSSLAIVGGTLWLVNRVRYELRADALCITYGPLCVRRVKYDNIEDVRLGRPLWNEHYNRFSRDPNLTLRLRRGGLARDLVINPARTDEFLAALRTRISGAPSQTVEAF